MAIKMPIGLRLIRLTNQLLDRSAKTHDEAKPILFILALHHLGYQIPAMAKALPIPHLYQLVAVK
jgi:hypothetical protein